MAMILRKWIRAKLETLGVVKGMMVYRVAETKGGFVGSVTKV
jgi:hypothetical protein